MPPKPPDRIGGRAGISHPPIQVIKSLREIKRILTTENDDTSVDAVGAWKMRGFLLPFVCAIASVACTIRTEHVLVSSPKNYRAGPEAYNLSERERRLCEKRASDGDILAAKQLVEYYEMVEVDEKQYQHWMRIVTRLQRARARHLEDKPN